MNSKAIFPLDEWVGNEDNPIQVVETSHTTIAVNGTNGILAALISSTPFDTDIPNFCDQMGREHRTLQQQFTGLCICWFRHLAKQENFDLRNQASVELAKLLAPVIEEYTHGANRLPYV